MPATWSAGSKANRGATSSIASGRAVEPPADLRQRSMVEVGRLEAGIQAGCAIREQGNRVSRLKTRQHPGGLARKP